MPNLTGLQHLLENLRDDFLAYLPILTVFAVILFLTSQFVPSWKLLIRSLPRHGRTNMSWQALQTLIGLLARGFEVRSLYKAARLRIEIELVNRAPEQPLRLFFDTAEEYDAEMQNWKADTKRWSEMIDRQLAAIVKEEEQDRMIEIEECSALLGDDDIARYFDACKVTSFLSKVTIKSGFVAPLHLLTGVLAHYDEEWHHVVDAYGRSVIRADDTLAAEGPLHVADRYSKARKMQSFIFDCWLLWGPSIPICTCPEWHGEVALQYGYGDEDNSLTLRCSSPEILRTLGGQNGGGQHGLALRTRVSGILKWGPDLGTARFCPAQAAIWQDKEKGRLVLDIVGEADGIRLAGGTQAQVSAQYYSAYLWIAFVICAADPDTAEPQPLNPDHQWRDLIPFFIHANIADREAYDFHTSQLARGAVEAAKELLHAEPHLILRFACASDETGCGYDMLYTGPTETVADKMERFAKQAETTQEDGAALRRLIFDSDSKEPFQGGDYSACTLPAIVKAFYNDLSEEEPAFHELRFTRQTDLDLLRTFYDDCFVPEFPDENERESCQQIENYLRLKETGWYGKNKYHVIILLDDGKPIGGAIADYLDKPNAGVIEYIVVRPEYRGAGWGSRLLEETERILHNDADRSRNRPLDWVAAEVDDPFVTRRPSHAIDPFAERPLHAIDPFAVARIWHKWGYRLLDFPYVQPALSVDKKPVETLMLSAKICSGSRFEKENLEKSKSKQSGRDEEIPLVPERDEEIPSVRAGEVKNLLHEYLRWAMRIDAPQTNPIFQKMCEFLSAEKTENAEVDLICLGDYLGWAENAHLHVNEVINDSDPEHSRAVEVYEEVFKGSDTTIKFRKAFQAPDGLAYRNEYRYHLWTIRSNVRTECEGIASFVRMPSAGFGGAVGFLDSLRGHGALRRLVARVEERIVRDGEGDGEQMVRDGEQFMRDGKQMVRDARGMLWALVTRAKARLDRDGELARTQMRHDGEQMVRYGEQMVHDGRQMMDDGNGSRGWYIECDGETQCDIFGKVGFWELQVEYMQPPLPGTADIEPPIRPLHLMYKPFGRVYEAPTIQTDTFLQAVREIYQSVYAIPDPDNDERFVQLKESLRGTDVVTAKTKPRAGVS